MFQEMLKLEEFIIFAIQVHIVPQNKILMQNIIFISTLLRKIKNSYQIFFSFQLSYKNDPDIILR